MSNSVRPHRQQPTRLPGPWDSPGKNTGVGCHFLLQCMKVKTESEVAQSCLTLSCPMDGSPPGSSVHGIFQARTLEWGAIAFSSVSSRVPDFLKKLLLYILLNIISNPVLPLLLTAFFSGIPLARCSSWPLLVYRVEPYYKYVKHGSWYLKKR